MSKKRRSNGRSKSFQRKYNLAASSSATTIPLGFEGRLLAGQSPQEAWQELRNNLESEPGSVELLRQLYADHPEAMEESRQDWAARGLEPPWAGLL